MKKVLLSLAVLGFATAANAQLLNYGFEDDQTAVIDTANWANFTESIFNLKSANAFTGSYGLSVSAKESAQRWERVIAFKQLGLQENKTYRVSFMASGNGNINVALMEGDWNADMAVVAGNGTTYVEQIYDQPITAGGAWQRVAYVFSVPSDAILDAAYAAGTHANPRAEGDFLRLSFTGEGNYAVDDIVVEEASIAGVDFNGTALRINFGYATNAAALAAQAGGTCVLDPSCVTVMVDGEEAAVEAVEIKSNGDFCIFLTEDYWLTEDNEVSVSFTNPGTLVYSTNVAPESFTNPNCAVYNFEAEAGYYNEDFYATSVEWEEAELVSADPADDSFEIDENVKEFAFTFNKPVFTIDEENGPAMATLDGEGLVVVEAAEAANTIKFTRTSTAPLGKGSHTLTIENVCNSKHVATSQPITTSFEVGQVQVAQTIYTELFTTLLQGAGNGQPTGWSIMVGGENWAGGEPKADNGSACRNQNVTGSDGVEYTAFYLCDREGYTYMQYGDQEEATLTLPAGNLEFSLIALSHDEAGHSVEFRLEDLEGNEIATANGGCAVIANSQFTSITNSDFISATFNNPAERQAILKVHALGGGYTAVRVLGFRVRSYEMTEGDTSDSQIVFATNFVGANMPDEGTGWQFYENNNPLAPGSGRSGTSGMLERNFHAKMQTAAFFRECGANSEAAYRIEYGDNNGVDNGLELAAGSYEIVYYAGTWNDDGGNANGTSKVFFQLIDMETGAPAFSSEHVNIANFKNGAQCNGQADKVTSSFKPTAKGNYVLKAWGTTNTVWGALTIEKEGSKAVKYHTMLNEAIDLANAELANSEAEAYDGTTKSALLAAVAKYSATPNGMHTPAEYLAAIAELNALTDALKARRTAIDAFQSDLEKLASALADVAGTKYENLDIVPTLQALYTKYSEINPSTLEDEELLSVQGQIGQGASLITAMKNAVNDFYTKQINNLLEAIAACTEELDNEFALGWITKGQQALSDDQTVAAELQKILTACLYQKIAGGYNFSTYDEEFDISSPDSLNITGYVANNMMYTINAQKNYEASAANAAFPGWNVTEGTVSNVWWWENPLGISETNPVVNASIHNIGGNAFKVNQELANLPVGVYTMMMKTADCSNIADVSTTYVKKDESRPWSESVVYAVVAGQDTVSCEANYGTNQVWRNADFTYLPSINGVAAAGEVTVAMTIGADINCYGDAAQVDDTNLYLTGKVEGFDYAAAAAQIFNNVPSELKVVEREDAPVAVSFINLNGQHTAAPQGVCLKVERYADGYTVVKKVVVK